MGLGGLTRDSIIGLNNLIHDDDDDLKPGHTRAGSWNNGSNKGSDDFLFLEGDDSLAPPESQRSFELSLNDGLATTAAGSEATTKASPSPPRRKTVYSKVSATNSRSLDSYRRDGPSEVSGRTGAQAAHYQGFQYEGYTDYYSEDFASYNDGYSHSNGRKGGEKKNIFCCLFAPWMQPKVIETEDQSVMSSLEVEQDQKRQETIAADNKTGLEASASAPENVMASPTPSLKEKIPGAKSLGSGIMPTPSLPSEDYEEMEPSEMPKMLSSETTRKSTPSKNEPSVNFAPPRSEEKPTTPHMMSDGLSDSELTVMSTSPDSTCFADEKKQDEGDLARNNVTVEASDEKEEDTGPPPTKGILKVKRCSASTSSSSLSSRNKSKKTDKEAALSTSPNMRHLFPTYAPKKSHTSDQKAKAINFNQMARVLTIPSRKEIPFHQKAQVWWQKCDYDEFKKTGRIISKAMECGGSEIWLASSNAWGNRAARSQQVKVKQENRSSNESDEYNKALSKYVNEEKKVDEANTGNFGEKWWCKFGHSRRGLEHIASSSEGRARQQSVLMAIRKVMEEQKRQRASRMKDPNKLRNVAMQYTSWARDLSLAAGSADAEAVASNFDPTASCRAKHFAKRLSDTLNHSDVGGGVAMAVTSQILDANTHGTVRTRKTQAKQLKDVNTNHDRSEDSLSRRAKGFMPGVQEDVSAAAMLSGMGNVGFRPTAKV